MGFRLGAIVVSVAALAACHRAASGATDDSKPAATLADAADPDDAYKHGVALVTPYLMMERGDIRADPQALADLRAGVHDLDAVIGADPTRVDALWARGQAQQALGDHEGAYQSLRQTYAFDRGKNPEVAKELVLECLETGRGSEGVTVGIAATQSRPDDAGMLANLALAYLIDGQVDLALQTVNRAAELDPGDGVTASARARIVEVKMGKRPPPHKLVDLVK